MIRPARLIEIDRIVEMVEETCNEMNYPFKRDYVKEKITEMINYECLLFVKEKDNELVGLLSLLIIPNFFDPTATELLEMIWYASIKLSTFGRARVMVELLDFMIFMAEEKKIQLHIALPEVHKTESIKELLKSRGFEQTEIYYRRRV